MAEFSQREAKPPALPLTFDRRIKLSQSRGDAEIHENEIGTVVVVCAVQLHQDLGPGLMETVYEVTLARKLEKQGLILQRQVPITIVYEGQEFEEGFRVDLIINGNVIVELK